MIDDEKPEPHIVVMGTLGEGFRFIGPFECLADARQYIGGEPFQEHCYIVALDIPAGDNDEN